MSEQFLDLSKVDFWLACVVAVLVLVPSIDPIFRKWSWTCLNIGFVALLLGWQALALFAAILVVHVLLRAIHETRFRGIFSVLAGLCLLGLFTLRKLPELASQIGLGEANTVLSLIGFSFIALRLVEVLRANFEKRHPPPDLPSLINYLIPFHMLAAGPIQSYDDFVAQPKVPEALTRLGVLSAFERIALGLFKKFVLAYVLSELFLTEFQAGGLYFVIEVQVFFFWLYLDFSAYSDIAVGVGRLIGVATPENFNRPYLARNVMDFWERWHISLSLFIRRNVFIPVQLGLARRSDGLNPLVSASLAFTLAFVLCGLWHGLSFNFLMWGLIHAAGLVLTNLYRHFLKKGLGGQRARAYVDKRWIGLGATVATYEFVALSLVVLF